MRRQPVLISILCLILLAACAPATLGAATPTGVVPIPPTQAPIAASPTPVTQPTVAQPVPTSSPIPVDLTPAQMAAIQALSKKNNIPVDQIQVASTEAVTWPSGCLGVVLPGVMCTQATVDGFRIQLSANGRQFEFHTNQDGTSVISADVQLALIRIVVRTSDGSVQLVDPNIPLGPTYNPAFNGLLPAGGSTAGTAYVLDFTSLAKAVAVDANGVRDLSFIQKPTYGLALWRGGLGTSPRLAWGTQLTGDPASSSLMVSDIDGSHLETLYTLKASSIIPNQLVAQLWSADGQALYFSQEPTGLGGYIPFSGASSLFRIDLKTKQVTELIPMPSPSVPITCLDAISGDYRFVANHCAGKTITVRDLTSGQSSTIQPPDGVTGFRLLGSARFSPDGKRLAFALAKGNPDDEQGWVAVSDGTSGASKLIATSQAGQYYTIAGWLDDQTLLVQSNSIQCAATCQNQLWTVGVDGSTPKMVADGTFLTIIDNQ